MTPLAVQKKLRLGNQLLREHPETRVHIFLLADVVSCGLVNQKTPDGYYNIGRMLKMFIRQNGQVKTCGTFMDARGMADLVLEEGISRSNMTEFAQWTIDADKVITF